MKYGGKQKKTRITPRRRGRCCTKETISNGSFQSAIHGMVSSIDHQRKSTAKALQRVIIPVLTYNGGTWGLTASAWERLDTFHRRPLRSLLGIRWPQLIPNRALYGRCHAEPISAHAAIQMGPVWAYPQTPSRHACRPRYAELLHLWGRGMARAATDNHRVHTIRGPRISRAEESEELGRPGALAGHRRGQASVARAVPGCTQ